MNIFSKIVKDFNSYLLNSKYELYKSLENDIESTNITLEKAITDFNNFKVDCEQKITQLDKESLNSGFTRKEEIEIIKSHINSKYNSYFSSYIDEVVELRDILNKSKREFDKLVKQNPELIDREKEDFIKSIVVLLDAYEAGLITQEQFKEAQLASQKMKDSKNWDFSDMEKFCSKKKEGDEEVTGLEKSVEVSIPETLVERKVYVDCIVRDRDSILLLKRTGLSDFEPGKWCLPGGHVEEGEDLKKAALRELQEETGIEFKEGEDIVWQTLKLVCPECDIYYFTLYVRQLDVEVRLVEEEHSNYIWTNKWTELELIRNLKGVLLKLSSPDQDWQKIEIEPRLAKNRDRVVLKIKRDENKQF